MDKNDILVGVIIEETKTFTYTEVCHKYNIPKQLLSEMMEHGLFSNASTELEQLKLNQKELHKIESAFRLHCDLGINLPGVVLAIELLEKIEKLNDELDIMRRHF
ncbi:molecular chaperone [Legionella lytica]|uniref:Molecular chaperone n=1 Tax=Legionella lytica TaxID=96232 RepID=A0ABY4YB61_9GAMM|nr:chaperone modulator CbpM [Legionella lytica]USQ14880.1 molecular chaperone [Legionella lytica]